MKMSADTKEIFKALIDLGSVLENSKKTTINPFFNAKYATLDSIIDDVRPLLKTYGLTILQEPTGDKESIKVSTAIIHESGQWIQSEGLTLPLVKKDAQGGCSAVTYARRYDLQAILNLASEDDDGNDASKKDDKKKQPDKPVEKIKGNFSKIEVAFNDCPTLLDLDKIIKQGNALAWADEEICKLDILAKEAKERIGGKS